MGKLFVAKMRLGNGFKFITKKQAQRGSPECYLQPALYCTPKNRHLVIADFSLVDFWGECRSNKTQRFEFGIGIHKKLASDFVNLSWRNMQ